MGTVIGATYGISCEEIVSHLPTMSANLGAEGKIGPQLYKIYCKPLFLGNKFDSDGFPVRLIRFKICVCKY